MLQICLHMNGNYRSFFSEQDYYPGGMVMPDRNFSYENYGFGFNGKLNDDEVKGSGNSYDFDARIYDPRVSKWLSMDPNFKNYPNFSPYVGFENNPIVFVDPDGKDARYSINGNTITISTTIYIYGPGVTESKALEVQNEIMSTWGLQNFTYKGEYNIKFDVKVQNIDFKNDTEAKLVGYLDNTGNNYISISDDFSGPDENGIKRSYVAEGKYGHWSFNNGTDDIPYGHEAGHLLGFGDRYIDIPCWNCHESGYVTGKNMPGVDSRDAMGTAPSSLSKVLPVHINAIGDYILKLGSNSGVIIAKDLNLAGFSEKEKMDSGMPPPDLTDSKQYGPWQ